MKQWEIYEKGSYGYIDGKNASEGNLKSLELGDGNPMLFSFDFSDFYDETVKIETSNGNTLGKIIEDIGDSLLIERRSSNTQILKRNIISIKHGKNVFYPREKHYIGEGSQ